MNYKKILVIGCNGFIGSHLSRYYHQKDTGFYGIDVIPPPSESVVPNFILLKPYELQVTLDNLFKEISFDVCINCSGAASVPNSISHPLNDFELNTLNVFRILESIRLYNPECRFINLSSAAVYGNPDSLPVRENSLSKPISPYGIHKLMSEEICREFWVNYGIKTCSLRIFSAFGPGLKKQFFWDLYQKFLHDSTIVLHGNGDETRDFIYIDDLIEAVNLAVENTAFEADVINIANGVETKIKEIASLFKEKIGSNKDLVFNGIIRPGDPLNWRADISILSSLGYKPKHSIEYGIQEYLKWVITQ
jgi:UDP-glucose 4-epimerase